MPHKNYTGGSIKNTNDEVIMIDRGSEQARVALSRLAEEFLSTHQNVLDCTNRTLELVNRFPNIKTNQEASESLRRLTVGIYAMKDQLPQEKQEEVTKLFIETCTQYISSGVDDGTLVQLLNTMQGANNTTLRLALEGRLSQIICEGLFKFPTTPEWQERLNFFKDNLSTPLRLTLSETDITDDQLLQLKGLPIVQVDLLGCKKLTKKALSIVGEVPTIKTLNIGGNAWVDDETLGMVPNNISKLSISACLNFTRQGLANLGKTSVTRLDLFGCSQLKDEDLGALPDQFESLDLRYCLWVKKRALQCLGRMQALRKLTLANIKIDEENIGLLPTHLRVLDLSGCKITNSGLEPISRMKGLEELYLNGSRLTDHGLPLLPDSIMRLELNRCSHLTDNGMKFLSTRQQLKMVSLLQCSNISSKGIEYFKDHVKVVRQELQSSHLAMTAFR